jgi:hypothetical protein
LYSSKVFVSNETWDVLQECVSRSYFANDSDGIRPTISFIGFPRPFSSDRERLAGESPENDVNHSLIRRCIKGSDVIPDWSIVNKSVLDAFDKMRDTERIVLDVGDCTVTGDDSSKGKVADT